LRSAGKTVSEFSKIAYIDGNAKAEMNPLIIKAKGVVAVDGLIMHEQCRISNGFSDF
jgi:hypothetical protein